VCFMGWRGECGQGPDVEEEGRSRRGPLKQSSPKGHTSPVFCACQEGRVRRQRQGRVMARGLMSQIEAQAPSSKLKQGHGVKGKGSVPWRGTRRLAPRETPSASHLCFEEGDRWEMREGGRGGQARGGRRQKENSQTIPGNVPQGSLRGDQKRCGVSFQMHLGVKGALLPEKKMRKGPSLVWGNTRFRARGGGEEKTFLSISWSSRHFKPPTHARGEGASCGGWEVRTSMFSYVVFGAHAPSPSPLVWAREK